MIYEITKTESVPLTADNRRSVTLTKGDTLDTSKFKDIPEDKVKALVKDGVLKRPAVTAG